MVAPKALSEKERGVLSLRITLARSSPELSGWELEFLTDISNRLVTYGPKALLTDSQRHRLEQIFAKADVPHPDEPDYEAKSNRLLLGD